MNIIVGFSKPVKFTLHGWLIMKIDEAPFDHAYIRVKLDKLQREIVFQSIAIGIQIVSVTEFETLSQPIEEYELDVSEEQFISLLQFCIDNSGKSYGLLAVIGLGIAKLLGKIGIKINNPFGEGKTSSEFCSEVITSALDNIDPKDFNLDPDNVSPEDLCILLQKLNMKRVL